jgi:predicted RNA-binding protein with PIN domain
MCYTCIMIIIVDAYNLLRAIPPYKKTITDQERAQFIAQLGSYGRRKGHKIVIVFDGGPHEWPFREKMKTVEVVYSGIHETADDYIKEYIDGHRAKDLLLVSSDSELNQFAARLQIPSIDSSSFNQLVHEELRTKAVTHKKADVVVKLAHDNPIDIDALMLEASKTVPVKSEDFAFGHKERDAKKAQLGKDERALLKKLNKL